MYRRRWNVLKYTAAVSKTTVMRQAEGMVRVERKRHVILEARGQSCKQCWTSGVVAAAVDQRKEECSGKKVQY